MWFEPLTICVYREDADKRGRAALVKQQHECGCRRRGEAPKRCKGRFSVPRSGWITFAWVLNKIHIHFSPEFGCFNFERTVTNPASRPAAGGNRFRRRKISAENFRAYWECFVGRWGLCLGRCRRGAAKYYYNYRLNFVNKIFLFVQRRVFRQESF